MIAKRREMAGTDEALRILRDIVWRARHAAQWVRENTFVGVGTRVLSAEDAEEISDHADEADDALLEAATILHPEMRADDSVATTFEQAMFARVPGRASATPDDIVVQVEEALSEALEHARDAAPYGVAMLSDPRSGLTSESVDRLWRAFEEAAAATQAALHALDPGRFSAELQRLTDADERIARASEIEHVELRREVVRRANAIGDRTPG